MISACTDEDPDMTTPPPAGPRRPPTYNAFPQNNEPGYNEWFPVQIPQFDIPDMRPTPIAIHAMVLESSSQQSEVFIHDPLRALTGYSAGLATWDSDGFRGKPILDHTVEHRVNSVVLRHERTLEWRVVRTLAIVDGNGTVTLIDHKQEGQQEG